MACLINECGEEISVQRLSRWMVDQVDDGEVVCDPRDFDQTVDKLVGRCADKFNFDLSDDPDHPLFAVAIDAAIALERTFKIGEVLTSARRSS